MFLTAFLTGAAETAKGYIEEDRKRLIESMDEQFKQHNKEAQESLTKSKEKRKILEERSKVFTALTDQYGLSNKLSVGAQLAIISDDKDFEAFRDDMNELAGMSEAERNARINIINKGITGKSNIEYDDITQGIDAATQIEDVSKPVVVRRKTVFGLPSNVQQRMLDDYKAENPELFSDKTRQAIPTTTGGYSGMRTLKFTKSEAIKNLADLHVSNLNKNFGEIKGSQGAPITFSVDVGGNVGSVDKLSAEAGKLQRGIELDTTQRIFSQLGKQGLVPVEVVLAVQSKFGSSLADAGVDLNPAIQNAQDKGLVYVGDVLGKIQKKLEATSIEQLKQEASTPLPDINIGSQNKGDPAVGRATSQQLFDDSGRNNQLK
jgi:hypothetical protein